MRIVCYPLLAALVAASPVPSVPSAPADYLRLGAEDVSAATKFPMIVEIDPDTSAVRLAGDRLKIAPATAALVTNREEARALVALALVYRFEPVRTQKRKPGTAEYVAALPLFLAAQGSEDRHQRVNGTNYPIAWNEPSGPDPVAVRSRVKQAKQGRAAYAVHLLQRSGGCSGPMVDLLNRMRAEDHTSMTASDMTNAGFARVVLSDLGRTVYPPDRSCE